MGPFIFHFLTTQAPVILPFLSGQIPFTSIQFPLYEFFKVRASYHLGDRPLKAYEAAGCGSVAGGVAAAATTPLDVLKTRVMLDMRVSLPNVFPPHSRQRTDLPRLSSSFSR